MEDNAAARRLLTEAAQIESSSALALGDLAMIHTFDAIWNWGISRDQSLAAAGEAGRRAVAIDENNAWGHIALGVVEAFSGRHDETVQWCNKTIEENPRFPGAYRILAATYGEVGDLAQAEKALEELLRQMPELTATATRKQGPWKKPEHAERYLNGLRRAGLPE